MLHHAPPTLVIGLGNPILSDDAAGWRVVEFLRQSFDGRSAAPPVTFMEACVGGLSLAELMVGYERAIVIDSMLTGKYVPGTVRQLAMENMPGLLNVASSHDTNLPTALDALRQYGAVVPADSAIHLVAIEARDVWTFSEKCSPEVESSIGDAALLVMRLLLGGN